MDLKKLLEVYDARLKWCQPIRELLQVLAGYGAPDPSFVGLGHLEWRAIDTDRMEQIARVTLHLGRPGTLQFSVTDDARVPRRVYSRKAADPTEWPIVIPEFLEQLRATLLGPPLASAIPPPEGAEVTRFLTAGLHGVIERKGTVTLIGDVPFLKHFEEGNSNAFFTPWIATYSHFETALEVVAEEFKEICQRTHALRKARP